MIYLIIWHNCEAESSDDKEGDSDDGCGQWRDTSGWDGVQKYKNKTKIQNTSDDGGGHWGVGWDWVQKQVA